MAPTRKFKIEVLNRSSKKLSAAAIRKMARAILARLALKRAALSILLVDDREIRRLNRRYLKHDRPTDVMAFSQLEGRPCRQAAGSVPFLGDVVISAATAARQAETYGNGFFYELSFYLCHGILHLLGHEDSSLADARRMELRQKSILKAIGVRNRPSKRSLWPFKKPKQLSYIPSPSAPVR